MNDKENKLQYENEQFTYSLWSVSLFLKSFLFFVVGLFWFSSFYKSVAFFLCSFFCSCWSVAIFFSASPFLIFRLFYFFLASFFFLSFFWFVSVSFPLLVNIFIDRFLDCLGSNSGSIPRQADVNWHSALNCIML